MESFLFLAMGDWGGSTGIFEINKMNVKKQKNIDFYILLGDNFYPSGVSSLEDHQWETKYKATFSTLIPSFAILGNHDYVLSPDSQILYSQKEPSWKMPFFYYDMIINLPHSSAHFIFLDTCILGDDITINPLRNTDTRPQNIERYVQIVKKYEEKQKKWLEEVLENSTSKWKIVCGHYPVYSMGPHMISRKFQQYISPLLEKYQVDFYISGHDHNLQHIFNKGINYVITGAFSSFYPKVKQAFPFLLYECRFFSKSSGFAKFEIKDDYILLEFIRSDGQSIYKHFCNKN